MKHLPMSPAKLNPNQDDEDEPSAQLHREVRANLQAALATRRPVLHHLNDDSSWFLQVPRRSSRSGTSGERRGTARSGRKPTATTTAKGNDRSGKKTTGRRRGRGERVYYNVLIDPWLAGGQSDVASWFSQQFHATPSAISSIAALEQLAREMERLAREVMEHETIVNIEMGKKDENVDEEEGPENGGTESYIDVVAVSHEFTDHCHKETLLDIHPDVPVFAIKEAADLIQSWRHFRTVITVPAFRQPDSRNDKVERIESTSDWRDTSIPPLPDWLGISRLIQTDDVLNYHSALLITFNIPQTRYKDLHDDEDKDEDDTAEAIIYTPHGIHASDLAFLGLNSNDINEHKTEVYADNQHPSPPIQPLALLHGLHNIRVGTASSKLFGGRPATALQSNLGAHNGLAAQRALGARYWFGTHDEVKIGGGLVTWFLQREEISLREALAREKETLTEKIVGLRNPKIDIEEEDALDGVNWAVLGNGESRVLI